MNYDSLEVKQTFVEFIDNECAPEEIKDQADLIKAAHPNTQSTGAACVDRIAAYAVDQCAMISRRQNVVAQDANLALGIVTLGSGLSAVAYAIKGTANDRLAATSLAGAASASNTGRAFLPSNTPVPADNIIKVASEYAELLDVNDDDVKNALSYRYPEGHCKREKSSNIGEKSTNCDSDENINEESNDGSGPNDDFEQAIIKLARVHDAAFSNCTANAYGRKPSAKPRF